MKKGFTLIELLAVIVILAIIALIAIPIILNIIKSTDISSAERSMENIEHAASLYYHEKQLKNNFTGITFTCDGKKCSSDKEKLEISGTVPEKGKIRIDEKGNITFNSIMLKGYLCTKDKNFKCSIPKNEKISNNNLITIVNPTSTEVINYRIYGNSVQNGTPTPENPIEIESVGDLVEDINDPNYGKYKITIKVIGKNLFDINIMNNYFYTINGNMLSQIMENGAHGVDIIIPAGIYTISSNPVIQNWRFQFWDNKKNGAGEELYITKTDKSKSISFEKDIVKIKIISHGNGYPVNISNIQLEVGEKATSYEPYKERKYDIYLDEPLRCIEDVCDYIDFKEGKIVRNIREKIFNGAEDDILEYIYFEPHSFYYFLYDKVSYRTEMLCNKVEYFDMNIWDNTDVLNGICSHPYHTDIYIKIKGINDLTTFKNYLKTEFDNGSPLKIIYPLSESIEEEINLPQIELNEEVSNIILDTKIQPNKIELEYYK